MDFNIEKCTITRFTRKQEPFTNSVQMSGTVFEEVKEFKDLGILIDSSLSWNSQIDMVTAVDTTTLKTLYCSLVRSYLEYCSVVWSPLTKRNTD